MHRNNGDDSFLDVSARTFTPSLNHGGQSVTSGDFDNDGDLDIYLVQGEMIELNVPMGDVSPEGLDSDRLHGKFYENQLHIRDDGVHELKFVDVTRESGIVSRGYGMGVATGDFDNDGCVDLYLTHVGPNQLFRNNCDGTFSDVSGTSGTNAVSYTHLTLPTILLV